MFIKCKGLKFNNINMKLILLVFYYLLESTTDNYWCALILVKKRTSFQHQIIVNIYLLFARIISFVWANLDQSLIISTSITLRGTIGKLLRTPKIQKKMFINNVKDRLPTPKGENLIISI